MNYKEAVSYIESAEIFGSRLGLDSIKRLMSLLGDPQKKLKFVHVAGTNGKGSVSSFIAEILFEAGYKTGLFTSPHIDRLEERIKINGTEITTDSFAEICGRVKSAAGKLVLGGFPQPTEFEIITAMALLHFSETECDIAVMEVGLGGRLDATNVIDSPVCAVITSISYDHTNVLGDSIEQIAFEKSGIIKEGCPVAAYSQEAGAMRVIEGICAERMAALHTVDTDAIAHSENNLTDIQIFDFEQYKGLKTRLLGAHQLKNAALAVKTSEILRDKGWEITEKAIRAGLYNTKWPGRFEIARKNPYVILDGAHNPEGASALANALTHYFRDMRFIFITGVLKDKQYAQMLEEVKPLAGRFFTVTPNSARALPASELAGIINDMGYEAESFDTVSDAVSKSLKVAGENEAVCCFGSLYFIGEVRNALEVNDDGV